MASHVLPTSQPGLVKPSITVSPQALSTTRVLALIGLVAFLAFAVYYFVGVDEGMASISGHSMVVHEFVHDARHLLGFPCH